MELQSYTTQKDRSASNKPDSILVRGEFDRPLFVIIILLLCFGSIMVFSASYAYAYSDLGDSSYYIRRQLGFAAGGVIGMLTIALIVPYQWIKKLTWLAFGVSTLLLGLVLVIGRSDGDAKRWLGYGSFSFQPSEIAKFALVLVLAWYMEKIRHRTLERDGTLSTYAKSFCFNTLIPLGITGATCLLVLLENHLSGTIILLGLGLAVMWAGGSKYSFFAFGVIVVLAIVGVLVFCPEVIKENLPAYQWKRIDMWLNPGNYDTQSDTWQTNQGLIAVGSGGIFGRGIGNSLQKHLFISQPQNDFIFAVLCEELGMIGAFALIVLYLIFFIRCMQIARRAPDIFSALTVIGIASHVLIQALLNMMVVTAMIPNTGISLPFFSYGGSSLLILLGEMGVILSISRYSRIQK